jgi:hypothetical protein
MGWGGSGATTAMTLVQIIFECQRDREFIFMRSHKGFLLPLLNSCMLPSWASTISSCLSLSIAIDPSRAVVLLIFILDMSYAIIKY